MVDIDKFAGAEHFLREVGQLADAVRTCPRTAAARGILLPGDPERLAKAQRKAGGIPLDDGTWGQLAALARELNVSVPVG